MVRSVRIGVVLGLLLGIGACATGQKRVPSAAGRYVGVLTQNEARISRLRDASRIEAFVHRKADDRLGFMGIALGMTHDQLNDLVRHSPWTYRVKSSDDLRKLSDSDRVENRQSSVLDIEPMFKESPWAKLVLEKPDGGVIQLPHGPVRVRFQDQRLVEVVISSSLFSAGEIEPHLQNWALLVSNALTARFGPAGHTYLDAAKVSFLTFEPGFDVTLAQWDMGRQRIRLTIGEDVSRSFFDGSIKLQAVSGFEHPAATGVPKATGHPVLAPKEAADKLRKLIARSVDQFRDQNWDGAITAATEALALSPGNGVAYLNRSAAWCEKHRFAQAIADATQAILQDPNQPLAYNNRGYALEASGKTAEALVDYEIACRLNGAMGCANFQRLGGRP
jgi:hypothetical protein